MIKKIIFLVIFILILFKVTLFSIQWPIKDFNKKHHLFNNFGQYQYYPNSDIKYKYMHTGVDIVASNNGNGHDVVYSCSSGKVVCIRKHPKRPKYHDITILDEDNHCAWLYCHIDIDKDLKEGKIVLIQDPIGTITEFGTKRNHIHFMKLSEGVTYVFINIYPPPFPPWKKLIKYEIFNPINDLSPNDDSVKPEIKSIKFRSAIQEGVYGALYLKQMIANIPIIYGNVDILNRAIL